MKIAVTGSTGYIGREIVIEALRQGHNVVALTRASNATFETNAANLTTRVCDLSDSAAIRDALVDCDCVIHLAADMKSRQKRINTINTTKNVLEAMRQNDIRQLVLCSSISVLNYVDEPATSNIDESIARCENDDMLAQYAAMKCEQERMAESWLVEDGILVIIRPGLVYDDANLSSAHAGFIKSGIGLAALHDGQVPLVHLSSVAKAFIAACSKTNQTGISTYHLVDHQLPTQRHYLKALKSARVIRYYLPLPWQLYRLLAKVFRILFVAFGIRSKLPDAFHENSVAARYKPFQFSNTKSCDVLDWVPHRTQL